MSACYGKTTLAATDHGRQPAFPPRYGESHGLPVEPSEEILQSLHVEAIRSVGDVAVGTDEEDRLRRLAGQAVGFEDLVALGLVDAPVSADERVCDDVRLEPDAQGVRQRGESFPDRLD